MRGEKRRKEGEGRKEFLGTEGGGVEEKRRKYMEGRADKGIIGKAWTHWGREEKIEGREMRELFAKFCVFWGKFRILCFTKVLFFFCCFWQNCSTFFFLFFSHKIPHRLRFLSQNSFVAIIFAKFCIISEIFRSLETLVWSEGVWEEQNGLGVDRRKRNMKKEKNITFFLK